ncbi:MAG: maleylpyruvate isomerase family mycothiol-dependent enzyme [Acidimicrobiales bacterium]
MNATEMYRSVQSSMVELCGSMIAEQAQLRVPTCPEWTPTDVLAHVVGIGADFKADRREGSGGDDWTAAQVESRKGMSVDDLLAEWVDLSDFLDEFFAAEPDLALALVADLVTHEHDIRLAIAHPGNRVGPEVTISAERYADRFLDRVAKSELTEAAVVVDGDRRGSGDAEVVLSGSAFDLLRAMTGRRSRAQVGAMNWDGDPAEHIEMISSYGPPSAFDIDE